MKYLLTICFSFIVFLAIGQDQPNFDQAVAKIQLQYDLSDAQTSSTKSLMIDKYNTLMGLNQKGLDPAEEGKQKKAILDKYDMAFAQLLNEQQLERYNAFQKMQSPIKQSSTESVLKSKVTNTTNTEKPKTSNQ